MSSSLPDKQSSDIFLVRSCTRWPLCATNCYFCSFRWACVAWSQWQPRFFFLFLSIYLSISMYLSIYGSIYLSIHPSIYLYIYLSLSVYPSMMLQGHIIIYCKATYLFHSSVSLCIFLYIRLFVNLSNHLSTSINTIIYLSMHLLMSSYAAVFINQCMFYHLIYVYEFTYHIFRIQLFFWLQIFMTEQVSPRSRTVLDQKSD